ncbi:hypothetical protein [Bartonella doshiae]|uniref:Uncharacterized protein n=2 Tax=Bartonella doshiae TaxID=33044 RepID=A0A380ZC23_BARDO|nr:hypothetical protein [Bartonella doshiae]EJF82037.1 hypothetical protein MCS_00462 [Bartonella doshiae NCTC 12862 = ATCC 700133]MBB6159032.1 hypothetical protein [Bartonella doshiae]SUV44537.1 Uncharacterised protein [Bartonella doshiae]
MANCNNEHQGKLKYWLTCIIGLFSTLAIIFVSGFYIAKPYLNSFAKREIARRSIKAETFDVSILGKVNLKNVTLPVPSGVLLKIGAISARPPISFIPGTFTFYNVDLKHNDIHIKIPKISINNVFLKEKDSTIASRILQSIMRVELASIVAPNIQLSVENGNNRIEKLEIKEFQLSGFRSGRIRSVGFKNIDLATRAANGTKQMYLTAKSNAFKIHDIDINYAYSLILGKNYPTHQVKTVTGPLSLENVTVNIFEEGDKEQNTSFSFNKFKTSGLKIKPFEHPPRKLITAYLNAKKENNQDAEKAIRNGILMNILLTIASADSQMNNLSIDTPLFQATLKSFQFKPNLWKRPIPKGLSLSLDSLSILHKKIDFERLNLSGKIDISYDDEKRFLSLNALSFNIKDMGSGKISSKVINVDEKLFSAQKDLMIAASQDIGITEIDAIYTDSGFIDKLFSYLTRNFNDSKHDLKQELYNDFYLIITQSPKILLKNHDEAEKISKSLGEFAKNPKTLVIKITAKDNEVLTLDDLGTALQKDFYTTLNKINLTVKNEASP